MDLCIQTAPLPGSLAERLDFAADLGVDGVNLGTYGHYFPAEVDPAAHLDDADRRTELSARLDDRGLDLAMLGAGNNPLHPDDETAAACDRELRDTIRLAAEMGVDVVTAHSGLPGAHPDDVTPNWLTARVPPEPHLDEAYDYQWDVAVEYWRDLAAFADDHGVDVAVEPHLNTLVHTPGDLLRLREATNDRVGAKLDPAHLFLQGIDELEAVRTLGAVDAIHAFEASDAVVHDVERRRKGVLDMTPLSDSVDRAWDFRAPGNGHDEAYWRELVTTLELVGFEGPLSIQHLNSPRPLAEGFERSAEMFREML